KHASRARYTLEPLDCGSWCLADLLLFRSTDATDSTLDGAIANALADLRHSTGVPLGIYWDLERASGAAVPVWVSVTVTPTRIGRMRRLATRLHLAPEISPVRLKWQSMVEGAH